MLVPDMERAHHYSVSVRLRASTGFRTGGCLSVEPAIGPQHLINSRTIDKTRIGFGLKLTVLTQGA